MSLWNMLTGQHPITEKDWKAMTAKQGYIKYAFRYFGGHINYPSIIDSVIEHSLPENPDGMLNVYNNLSSAGIEVNPGQLLFSVPLKNIISIQNSNQKEFSGAFLIHGLGALLQETRYFIAIQFYDENNNKQKVAFGTTMAIKSENYFSAFYKSFIDTLSKVNPKSLSGEPITENTTQDLATQLEKLSQLKEKGMLTDEEFIAAKSKLLNGENTELNKDIEANTDKPSIPDNPPAQAVKSFKVKITAPNDSKLLYNMAKELCKDVSLSFAQAKDVLTKGTTLNFKDQNTALRLIEKYNNMGCKTDLKEN